MVHEVVSYAQITVMVTVWVSKKRLFFSFRLGRKKISNLGWFSVQKHKLMCGHKKTGEGVVFQTENIEGTPSVMMTRCLLVPRECEGCTWIVQISQDLYGKMPDAVTLTLALNSVCSNATILPLFLLGDLENTNSKKNCLIHCVPQEDSHMLSS